MEPINIHNGGIYVHSTKFIRTFIGQFLNGNSNGPIKIHSG